MKQFSLEPMLKNKLKYAKESKSERGFHDTPKKIGTVNKMIIDEHYFFDSEVIQQIYQAK